MEYECNNFRTVFYHRKIRHNAYTVFPMRGTVVRHLFARYTGPIRLGDFHRLASEIRSVLIVTVNRRLQHNEERYTTITFFSILFHLDRPDQFSCRTRDLSIRSPSMQG